jgi:hypothetical protein
VPPPPSLTCVRLKLRTDAQARVRPRMDDGRAYILGCPGVRKMAASSSEAVPTYSRSRLQPPSLTADPTYSRSRLQPPLLTADPTYSRSHLQPPLLTVDPTYSRSHLQPPLLTVDPTYADPAYSRPHLRPIPDVRKMAAQL